MAGKNPSETVNVLLCKKHSKIMESCKKKIELCLKELLLVISGVIWALKWIGTAIIT